MLYENRTYIREQFPFACARMEGCHTFMNHCHKEIEIIVLCQGEMSVSFENEHYVLGPGDMWIIPPFCSHSIDDATDESVRLALLLDPDIMGWVQPEYEKSFMTGLLESTDLYSRHWPVDVAAEMRTLAQTMFDEYTGQELGWQLAVKTALNELILVILRRLPRCEKKIPSRHILKVREILEYAALNYCGEISLEECASKVGFNPTYLSRYFHRHMGMTFQEYIKKLRIDRARLLLQSRNMPITEVAYASGFKDIKTFNKMFRQECGISPSQYRKNLINVKR